MLRSFIVGVLISLFCFSKTAFSADIVYPSPDITPAEVVAIQLNGLQYNDAKGGDAGIRQTWEFAHPRNRAVTGPLSRFAMMLKGPNFGMMLNHISHTITLTNAGNERQNFNVLLEVANGDVMALAWIVEKVAEGKFKGCWMTVAVSAPLPIGQGS